MIPLFYTNQIRNIDEYAIKNLEIPSIVLMENVALNITNIIKEKYLNSNEINSIGILCGKGNNGGDGYAVARHLSNLGYNVYAISIGNEKELSKDALVNYRILKNIAKDDKKIKIINYDSVKSLNSLKKCDVIIDAMLGSGFSGELKEPYLIITNFINKLNSLKISIDVPTGLNADTGYGKTTFKANTTITLGELKPGLFIQDGYESAGNVELGEIGVNSNLYDFFNNDLYLIEPEDALEFLPKKRKTSQKYSSGKVFVLCGSGKYPGAAAIVSMASLNSGAGAVILGFPDKVKKLLFNKITIPVVDTYNDKDKDYLTYNVVNSLNNRINWAEVIALGSGLGRNEETVEAVHEILRIRKNKPIVLDADGIYAINKCYNNFNLNNVILTPHHKEFSDLLGIEINELERDLISYGKKFVSENKCFLVLKGAPTIIFNNNQEVFINTSGNPGLSKFGSGDALTGIISSLIAQNKNNIIESVISAVYIHSLSADILVSKGSEYSYTAMDIISNLQTTFNFLRRSFVKNT